MQACASGWNAEDSVSSPECDRCAVLLAEQPVASNVFAESDQVGVQSLGYQRSEADVSFFSSLALDLEKS